MLTQNAGADYMLTAANITKKSVGKISTHAKTLIKQATKDVITSSKGSIKKHAQKEIQNNSGEKTKLF